jgi:hypothetical protein
MNGNRTTRIIFTEWRQLVISRRIGKLSYEIIQIKSTENTISNYFENWKHLLSAICLYRINSPMEDPRRLINKYFNLWNYYKIQLNRINQFLIFKKKLKIKFNFLNFMKLIHSKRLRVDRKGKRLELIIESRRLILSLVEWNRIYRNTNFRRVPPTVSHGTTPPLVQRSRLLSIGLRATR